MFSRNWTRENTGMDVNRKRSECFRFTDNATFSGNTWKVGSNSEKLTRSSIKTDKELKQLSENKQPTLISHRFEITAKNGLG